MFAAAGDHDPPHRLVGTTQLAHHLADMHGRGEAEDLVTREDEGFALGRDGFAIAIDRRDPHLDVG